MKEIWRGIEGYKGLYQISSTGKVKRLKRIANSKNNSIQTLNEKILKIQYDKMGYYYVKLSKNKTYVRKNIHKLVAQAFIPNPENKPQVNHKNGIKTDNCIKNLEWCTASENAKHSYLNSLQTPLRGENVLTHKLTNNDVLNIRKMYKQGGYTHRSLGKIFNVSNSVICEIVNNKSWKHV